MHSPSHARALGTMVKPYIHIALASIAWVSSSFRAVTGAFLPIVPAVHTFSSSSAGDYQLPSNLRIVVDAAQASSREDNGLSLIPPTLSAFAQTFAADLEQIFPTTSASVVTLDVGTGFTPNEGDIILTILPDSAATTFTLASGAHTTEGYQLETTSSSIKISGSGAKGAFWGTRTVLQGLVVNAGKIPGGTVIDQPDWETRGFMLDVGRQWYPITFLTELCAYASWFKMSEFHVHLSDNLPGNDPNAYARFRLRSMVSALTPHVNETYSREQFEDFQQQCAARGVTVIPELESPGHALVIAQWKPELALSTDPTLLNLSFPDTIPTVKSIWQEFLPWIHSKQVSIGADEYDSALADDYNNFVNTMSDFIGQQSQKTIRIWGTNEPSNRTAVSKNITIQHWDFGQDQPFSLISQGYNLINSEDSFQYIVMKQSGSFPQQLDQDRLWTGANTVSGGIWDPHVFDRGNATNNPAITDPRLHGAIMAAWNDHGRSASTYLEAFYSIKSGLPVIAASSWQAASRANHLTRAQFLASFPSLERAAPGQNLDRRISSKGSIVAEYVLSSNQGTTVPDQSGNGYTGTFSGSTIHTPLTSKGHNYTLLVNTTSAATPGMLLAGPDDTLALVSSGRSVTLAFNSTNITYPLSKFTLPTRPASSWMEIIITGTEAATSAFVNGVHVGDFEVSISRTSALQPMAFVAPVQEIGAPEKQVTRFVLWDGLQDIGTISAFNVK